MKISNIIIFIKIGLGDYYQIFPSQKDTLCQKLQFCLIHFIITNENALTNLQNNTQVESRVKTKKHNSLNSRVSICKYQDISNNINSLLQVNMYVACTKGENPRPQGPDRLTDDVNHGDSTALRSEPNLSYIFPHSFVNL